MFSNHQRDWLNARIEKQRINRENKIMTTSKVMFKLEDIQRAIFEDAGIGFCVNCGQEERVNWIEPNSGMRKCHDCKRMSVYGAEQIVIEFPELIIQE